MEEDFTEESSYGTLVRGDDHSYDAHKFPVDGCGPFRCPERKFAFLYWPETVP